MSAPGIRRLVGNLDFEATLVPPGPSALPLRVRRTLSALATLLRVFARPGDRLWTPLPVAPDRLPEAPGCPVPELETGPLEDLPPATALLAWAESEAVHRLRVAAAGASRASAGERAAGPLERAWTGPYPAPETARRVHHRSFQLEAAGALGVALPGARLVASPEELAAHLQAGGASPAPGDSWVVKGGFSAAGRDRLRGAGRALPAGSAAARLRGLFARHGTLLFEPWFDRIEDLGCAAWVSPEGVDLIGVHRQEVDGYGRFRGLTVGAESPESSLLAPGAADGEALRAVAIGVGRRLADAGYVGPFGLDAWRYRDRRGEVRLHPLGEINARLTIGLVAHALVRRLAAAGDPPRRLRLRLGRALPANHAPGSGRVLPLLSGGPEDPTVVWAEVVS